MYILSGEERDLAVTPAIKERASPLAFVVPGAAATSPPPPVIFSQVAASRFRGAPPPVIFASRRPRHIFWQTTIFTYGSDEMPFLQCDYYCMTYKLLNPLAHALIGLIP
jgi:hypothetical protein